MHRYLLAAFLLIPVLLLGSVPADEPVEVRLLDEMLTEAQQHDMGLFRLTTTEKQAFLKWLNGVLHTKLKQDARKAIQDTTRRYFYHLADRPEQLTEKIAVAKARQTFSKEGHSANRWKLTRAHFPETTAPDGTKDEFFCRYTFRPTAGRVFFTDGDKVKGVVVALEDDWVECSMFFGP